MIFSKVHIVVTLKKLNHSASEVSLGDSLWASSSGGSRPSLSIGGSHHPTLVISGVLQGILLGPLLFLVLIGDTDSEATIPQKGISPIRCSSAMVSLSC